MGNARPSLFRDLLTVAASAPSRRNEGEKPAEPGQRQDVRRLLLLIAVHDYGVAGLQRDVLLRAGFSFEDALDVDLQCLSAAVAQLAEHDHAGLVTSVGEAAGSGDGLQ